MKTITLALVAALGLALVPVARSQQAPGTAYEVEFYLTSQKASVAPVTHEYSFLVRADGGFAEIQAGNKVPIATGKDEITYQSIGLTLQCHFSGNPGQAGKVGMNLRVSISSVVPSPAAADPGKPTISNVFANVITQVPIERKETISSFSDPTTHTHYELAALVKPMP